MKKQISILRSLVCSLLAMTMLCAMPLFTACGEDTTDPVETPKKELPADAGAITQTPLEDGTVELSVSEIAGAETYRWYKDGESVQNSAELVYLAKESGNYKVAGVNRHGEGKASAEVKITVQLPGEETLPADAGTIEVKMLENGAAELSIAEIERAETYRWYKDGEVAQDGESRTYLAMESGNYKVAGVNSEGEGKASAEVEVTVLLSEEFSATVEATKLAFNDIQISVLLTGTKAYYGGNTMSAAFVAEDILASLEMLTPSTQTAYEGALVDFPEPSGEVILPGESYTVWIVLPKEDASYTAEDILTFEFTAPELASGGSINVEAGEPYLSQTEVEVELSAKGAYAIHQAWLSAEQMAACTDAAAKVEVLLNATQFEGESAYANSGTSLLLEPESDVYLLAMAIDQEGRYGEIFEQKYTTLPEPKTFTLTIAEELCAYTETTAEIHWNIEDGEAAKVVYYLAPADDNFWLLNLGESFDRAIEYIQINPAHANFKSTTDSFIELTNLTEGRRYVFVAVAFDADDIPSMGDGIYFTPQSNVVFVSRYLEDGTENPEWTASCPKIEIQDYCFVKGQMTRLFWMVDLAEGTTGYTAAISATYVAETFSTAKAWAQDIMNDPDDAYSVYYWIPDDPAYPDPNDERGTGGMSKGAPSTQVFEDKIYYHPYGVGDMKIYVTWTDAQGRLYECVSADLPVIEAE